MKRMGVVWWLGSELSCAENKRAGYIRSKTERLHSAINDRCALSDRQHVGVFHLLQREARLDRRDALDARELLLDEALIGVEVGHHHAQPVVTRAGHQVALQHLGP